MIYYFMIKMFKQFLKRLSDRTVLDELEGMKLDLAQMRTQISDFENNVMDKVLATNEKISKRLQTRMKREMNENELEEDTFTGAPQSVRGLKLFGGRH